jgi:subtilase family serine protease
MLSPAKALGPPQGQCEVRSLRIAHLETPDFYSPISVYCAATCNIHGWQTGDGTSSASPLFAGELALADEAAAPHHEAAVGLVNPLIYRLGQVRSPALRRITIGNNDVYGLGCCQARPGYSEAWGWGTPEVPALIAAADLAGE